MQHAAPYYRAPLSIPAGIGARGKFESSAGYARSPAPERSKVMLVLTITQAHGKNMRFTAHNAKGREVINAILIGDRLRSRAQTIAAMATVHGK
jgi:hypothetical protein